MASPILEALRTSNIRLLQGVDDVAPLDVERYLQEAERSVTTMGRVDMLRKQAEGPSSAAGKSSLVGWLIEAGVPEIVAQQAVESMEPDESAPLLDIRQNALERARALIQSTVPITSPSGQPQEPKERVAKKQAIPNESLILTSIVKKGSKSGLSPYDALKQAGWIQSMDTFVG